MGCKIGKTVSTGVTAADVWAYHEKKLTGLNGQARIDLLGEDADFESGTGSRKRQIDEILVAKGEYEGSVLMDGSEQALVATSNEDLAVLHELDGIVDLSSLVIGDTIVAREYLSVVYPASYVKYAEREISGPLDKALLVFATKTSKYGVKVTLQQTAGTMRTIPYDFFLKREKTEAD